MYFTYSLVLYLFAPLVMLRLLYRSRKNPDYLQRWPERFGFVTPLDTDQDVIWIHAVSVGEVQAARPLVDYLQENYPQYHLLITTTTPTGASTAASLFTGESSHRYLPYDLDYSVSRFIRIIRPRVLLILETEIWPNLYRRCRLQSIPVALINARLSDKAFKRYMLIPGLVKTTLGQLSVIAAQSEDIARRFIRMGCPADKVTVTGNLKFDIKMPHSIREQGEARRQYFSASRPVWIAASTHAGEEDIILEAAKCINAQLPDSLLILAPRHPERFAQVEQLCRKQGLTTACYTEMKDYDNTTQVFLLNVLGQLPVYYAAADVAFVGGSLVPVGGHNMLEPASMGIPVISGEKVFNFSEVSNLLWQADALSTVTNAKQLCNKVLELFDDANLRYSTGEKAKRVVIENQGSINRITRLLAEIIP